MGKKEDIEEINKWNKEHEEKLKKEYGDNLELLKEKTKTDRKNIKKINDFLTLCIKVILMIGALIIIVSILIFTFYLKSINEKTNINVKQTIEQMYGKKIIIKSQDIDKNKNGVYEFETKDNIKINFKAIKNYGSFNDDYSNQCLKYYFEKWDSENKNRFTSEEKRLDNGLLDYKIFANINNFNDIDSIVDAYKEFKDFSKEYYFEDWNIWVRSGEYKDILVTGTGYQIDEIKDRLKTNYVSWVTKNNIKDITVTNEIINKYYKEKN